MSTSRPNARQPAAACAPPERSLRLSVNGEVREVAASPAATLAEVLRSDGCTEVKLGCERGECGACTVLVGGRPVHACTTLASLVDADVMTAEGLADETRPLRRALAERGGFQCGFCTPGHVAAAAAYLREHHGGPAPDEPNVRAAMNGNICRCTGYQPILDAIGEVADGDRATCATRREPPTDAEAPS